MASQTRMSQRLALSFLLPLLVNVPGLSGLSPVAPPAALAQFSPPQRGLRQIEMLRAEAERALWRRDYDRAISGYEQVLALAQQSPDPEADVPLSYFQLGLAHFQKGNNRQAIASYEKSLAVMPKDSSTYQGQVLAYIGMVYLSSGDYTQALAYAQKAQASTHPDDFMTPAIVAGLQGEALYRTGRLKEAELVLRQAIKAFESARLFTSVIPNQEGGGPNELFFEMQAGVSRSLQQVLVAQNQVAPALEMAEWGRGRIFAELMALRLTPIAEQTSEQRQRIGLQQSYAEIMKTSDQFLQQLAQMGLSPDQIQDLPPEALQQLVEKFSQNEELIQSQIPQLPDDDLDDQQFQQALQAPIIAPPTLQQIQQVARQQQATLVQYSLISDSTFGKLVPGRGQQLLVWIVQPTGALSFKTIDVRNLKTDLETLVSNSRAAIGVQARGLEFQENRAVVAQVSATQRQNATLQELYQALIQPIADQLPKDPNQRVIFIPQGELFKVPFVALQDSAGKYLLQKHTISTAPAIQVLVETHKQRQRLRQSGLQKVLVVGNPKMPKLNANSHEQLTSLPGAELEAKAIAQLFKTDALIGEQATKVSVVQQMAQSRIIHLATHGVLDQLPGLAIPGAIALAPSATDSGWLTASELLDLKLNAELVVLSACDTGRGDITGDGVVGLSRSLVAAGVPSVIVSLWKVPDEPTAFLMTEFYQTLSRQGDKAQALRQAMLKTMKAYPDPKDWAAFVLIGEAQ